MYSPRQYSCSMVGLTASAAPLPTRPPATAPTTAPTLAPTGPATSPPTSAPVVPPPAAPAPTPTGCAPGAPVIGSGFASIFRVDSFSLASALLRFMVDTPRR